MTFGQLKRYVVDVLKGWFINKKILDGLSESGNGKLLYKNRSITEILVSSEQNNAIIEKDDGIWSKNWQKDLDAINDGLDILNTNDQGILNKQNSSKREILDETTGAFETVFNNFGKTFNSCHSKLEELHSEIQSLNFSLEDLLDFNLSVNVSKWPDNALQKKSDGLYLNIMTGDGNGESDLLLQLSPIAVNIQKKTENDIIDEAVTSRASYIGKENAKDIMVLQQDLFMRIQGNEIEQDFENSLLNNNLSLIKEIDITESADLSLIDQEDYL